MKNNVNKSVLVFALVALSLIGGCGDKSSFSGPNAVAIKKLGSLEYGVIGGNVVTTDGSISGSGTVLFKNPLPEEDNHFALTVTLAAGAKITVATNTDNTLKTGVALTLARSANDKIVAHMITANENTDVSAVFTDVDSTKAFQVEYEVHPHGHMIFPTRDPIEEFDFTTRPTGKFWGLMLENATVSAAVISKVQDE